MFGPASSGHFKSIIAQTYAAMKDELSRAPPATSVSPDGNGTAGADELDRLVSLLARAGPAAEVPSPRQYLGWSTRACRTPRRLRWFVRCVFCTQVGWRSRAAFAEPELEALTLAAPCSA